MPERLDTGASGAVVFGAVGAARGVAQRQSFWHDDTVYEKLAALALLQPNWDGEGAPVPGRVSLDAARDFWRVVAPASEGNAPAVGPANDGGVVFEWEMPGERSLYCYIREHGVQVAAFDGIRDYADLRLPVSSAGIVVTVLLSAPTWS